jgi:hypothetical protein
MDAFMPLVGNLSGDALMISDGNEKFGIRIILCRREGNAGNAMQRLAMFFDGVIANEIRALANEMTDFIEALFEQRSPSGEVFHDLFPFSGFQQGILPGGGG